MQPRARIQELAPRTSTRQGISQDGMLTRPMWGTRADKPFDHESRMKDLLARQAKLNAALDLYKNGTQVAPPAEDDMGLAPLTQELI